MAYPSRVVVVGGGLAAHNTIEHLRRKGFDGSIELIGDETLPPYDRPPLSKDMLWEVERPAPRLLGGEGMLDEAGVTFRAGVAATGVDIKARVVRTSDGEQVGFDNLVIATGASARTLATADGLEGVFTLRTYDDSLVLRDALAHRPRLVIVGAGLIGCEVACGAAAAGLDVTMVDPLPAPMGRALGLEVGQHAASLLAERGISLVHGVGVTNVIGSGRVEAVGLTDGSTLPADAVLVAFGAAPRAGWVSGSGIPVNRGILTDRHGQTSVPGIYAIGDVAEGFQDRSGEHAVVEHWMNAREQGAAVASSLLGEEPPRPGLPYFWSDQGGVKIQVLGWHDAELTKHLSWSAPKPGSLHLYGTPDRLTGAAGFNAAGKLMRLRGLIESGASWDEAESLVLG